MQYFIIETNSGTILKLWNNTTIPDFFASRGHVIFSEPSIEDIRWDEIIPSYGMIYNLLKMVEICKLAMVNRNSINLFINHYTNNLPDPFPASNTESDDSPENESGNDSSYYSNSGYSGDDWNYAADVDFENQLDMEVNVELPPDRGIAANTFSKEKRIQSLKTIPISKFFYIKKEDIDSLYDDARKKLF
jgi:hypothetical protein